MCDHAGPPVAGAGCRMKCLNTSANTMSFSTENKITPFFLDIWKTFFIQQKKANFSNGECQSSCTRTWSTKYTLKLSNLDIN